MIFTTNMSLKDFIQNRTKQQAPSIGGGSLQQFIQQRQRVGSLPEIPQVISVEPEIPTKKELRKEKRIERREDLAARGKKTFWQWVGKQLMKPVGIVAAETEALGRFIGTGQGFTPGKAGLGVLIGKREASFSKVWRDNAQGFGFSPSTAGKIGFVFDLTSDPLNFIGGGLTKLGKLATKTSSLSKAGKAIKASSKLGKQIAKSGYTVEELVLAGTKAEQVAKGQRALLKIAGKSIIGGSKVYKGTERLGQILKATKLGQGLRRTFTTKTGIKELDTIVDNFNNLSSARKQKVIDKALKIQKNIKSFAPEEVKMVAEAIENPVAKALIKDKKIITLADEMEDLFKGMKQGEKAVGVLKTELANYFPHIKAKEAFGSRLKHFFNPQKYSASLGAARGRQIKGTVLEIEKRFGKEFFQSNPAMAYAQRGLASAKAVTAKEFLNETAKKFFVNAEKAPLGYVESTNPILNGLKANPEVVRAIDQYIEGIKPQELKLLVRGYDKALSWWKAQVLISPSYHLRNTISNYWNNWLAGVKNPISYVKARAIQGGKKLDDVLIRSDAGEVLTRRQVLKEVKETRVMGKGWYGADITTALGDETSKIRAAAKKTTNLMPWKQENILFKTNRAVGQAIEDNARIAHFIEMRQKGMSVEDAARSVKKFLFDYEDLSKFEKVVLKRIFPFYTWTRKNIPIQLENIITQPEKFAAVPKVIQQIEANVPAPSPAEEKYMAEYIKENVPVRFRENEDGGIEYFLLGNWLPSAQAIDFLSQPFQNMINMATPFLKTPYEIWANKSTFFRNTLGESSKIEYYYKQPTEFVGITMRKKTAHLMRNIRILNDINKLVQTTAKDEPENSAWVRLLNVLIGKAATFDVKKSKQFYQRETQDRENEIKAAIKKSIKLGNKKHADKLKEELKRFKKQRK